MPNRRGCTMWLFDKIHPRFDILRRYPARQAAPSARAEASLHLVQIAQLDPEAALKELGTDHNGLGDGEAAARLRRHGTNEVAQDSQRHLLTQLALRLWTPLNALLLGLAGAAYFLSDPRAA